MSDSKGGFGCRARAQFWVFEENQHLVERIEWVGYVLNIML
jgi:hypothetical protein